MSAKKERRILVLIDWDNLFLNLMDIYKPEKLNLSFHFDNLKKWLEEIGQIWAVFVFAPQHLNVWHRKFLQEREFFLVTCTKIKTGETPEEIDTVDETLIKLGELLLSYPDITHLCLVSGDADFIPLLEKAKKEGVKRAIAVASVKPLSRNLLPLADTHPKTRKKMILDLSKQARN